MSAKEEVNARATPYNAEDALALTREVNDIYIAKGKKVVHLDLKKEKPDQQELKRLLVGPTGNLRAPTLRKGKTLIVGFDQATYESIFG